VIKHFKHTKKKEIMGLGGQILRRWTNYCHDFPNTAHVESPNNTSTQMVATNVCCMSIQVVGRVYLLCNYISAFDYWPDCSLLNGWWSFKTWIKSNKMYDIVLTTWSINNKSAKTILGHLYIDCNTMGVKNSPLS